VLFRNVSHPKTPILAEIPCIFPQNREIPVETSSLGTGSTAKLLIEIARFSSTPRSAELRQAEKDGTRLFAVRLAAKRVQVQVEMVAMSVVRLGAQYRFELSAGPLVETA
jgi:hypothetical protein